MSQILLIFCVSFLLLDPIAVRAQGQCELEGVSPEEWLVRYQNDPRPDSERVEFKSFKMTNIESLDMSGEEYSKYFSYEMVGDTLTISPSVEFESYETNEPITTNPQIFVFIDFSCSNGLSRRLNFYQPIIDQNTHNPEFLKTEYNFKLPMPLPADFDVAIFGEEILARDLDITNSRLDFAVQPADKFVISYDRIIDQTTKIHKAIIKTINPLRLKETETFTLTVTDVGTPPKRSTAILHIDIDEDNTLPANPEFLSALYLAHYTINDDNEHKVSLDQPLALDKIYSDLEVRIRGDYSGNFKHEVKDDGTIDVSLNSNLPEEVLKDQPVLMLTIEVTIPIADGPAKTALNVYLPKMECTEEPENAVIFEKENYSFEIESWQIDLFGTLKATSNSEEEIIYSFEENQVVPPEIELSPNTGELSLGEAIQPGIYTFVVRAVGQPSQTKGITTVSVKANAETVKVTFERENYSFEIVSWKIGLLGYIKADSTAEEEVRYSPEAIEGETFPPGLQLNTLTGELFLSENLDPEIYNFVAHAEGIDSRVKASINIAINVKANQANVILFERENYNFNINPWHSGFLANLKAIADPQETITYSLVAEGGEVPSGLQLNPNTGELRLIENLNTGTYTVVAIAQGTTSGEQATANVAITVNENENPVIVFEKENYVFDVSPEKQGFLGFVKATSSSSGNIKYSIQPPQGQPPEIKYDENTGELSLSQKLDSGEHNFIAQAQVQEGGSTLTAVADVVIHVRDGPTIIIFERENYSFQINPWQTGLLATLKATSTSGEDLEYSLVSVEGETLPPELRLNSNTGQLSLNTNLNPGTYSFAVQAKGLESLTTTLANIAIRVNENENSIIIFERENYDLKISSPLPGFLASIKAVASPNEPIKYSLREVEEGIIPSEFTYNRDTGELQITETLQSESYKFLAVAKGSTSQEEAVTMVSITVDSDGKPKITFEKENYNFQIHVWLTGVLGTFKATATPEENIHYFLKQAQGEPLVPELKINTNTGELSLTGKLSAGVYKFLVQAEGVDSKITKDVNVAINVQDASAIIFERENYSLEVNPWDVGFLALVKATASPTEDLQYSLSATGGETLPPELQLNTLTGELSLTDNLNPGVYKFLVEARGVQSQNTAVVNVAINVKENENKVVIFERENYSFEISTSKTGHLVFLKAVASPKEDIIYSPEAVAGGSIPTELHLDETTGELSITEQLGPGIYSFLVRATGIVSQNSAVVNVAINVKDNPAILFERENYSFEINPWDIGFLVIFKATANPNEEISYSLIAVEGSLLPSELQLDPDTGELSLADNLNPGVYKFLVQAEGIGSTNTAVVNVAIKVKDNENKVILFERENYSFEISSLHTGFLGFLKATASPKETIKYSLHATEGGTLPTQLQLNPNTGEITLNDKLNPGIYNFLAQAEGLDSANKATVNIEINVKDRESPLILFERENYSFEINPWDTGFLAFLKATANPNEEIKYSLDSDGGQIPSELKLDQTTGELSLTGNLNPGIYNLLAKAEGLESSEKTTVKVAIKVNENENPVIIFERENYNFEIGSWQTEFSAHIKAIASPKEDIKYTMDAVEGEIPSQLQLNGNTGEISLTGSLEAGIYNFLARAEGVESKNTATVNVAFKVDVEDENPQTTYSVIVKHLKENEEGQFDLPCNMEVCNYRIIERYPQTEAEFFEVSSGQLVVKKLDREMDEIVQLKVPQFSLKLKLENNLFARNSSRLNHGVIKRDVFAEEPKDFALIPNQILNTDNEIVVAVIVDDDNDNEPIFDAGTNLIVGYPDQEILESVKPSYLAKVIATDKDEGENAEIVYSTNSRYFVIHPKTGIIYAGEGSLDASNLKFNVIATDRNGNGHPTSLEIEVKLLTENHLVLLSVKNLFSEDIDQKVREFSEKTNLNIQYLTTSFAISRDNSRKIDIRGRTSRADADFYTRIIVYGLGDENIPVENGELKEAFEDAVSLEEIVVDKWEPPSNPGNGGDNDCAKDEEECSNAGLIAAVSVLGALLLILIIVVAVFYYLKVYRKRKPEPYAQMEEDASSAGSALSMENEKRASTRKSPNIAERKLTQFEFKPPPPEEDDDDDAPQKTNITFTKTPDYITSPSVRSDSIYDDLGDRRYEEIKYKKPIQNNDKNEEDEDEFGERKVKFGEIPTEIISDKVFNKADKEDEDIYKDKAKSVTFKETVQKINILVDDEKQDEGNSSNTKDDDDILSSHL